MNIRHNQRIISHLYFFLIAIIISSCTSSPSNQILSAADFPNILNLKGIPDSLDDRSVFVFSDLGAWHGYALPTEKDKAYIGSFVGPFIMTQDNGLWLSECLSKMEIINRDTEEKINLKDADLIANNSFPNRLHQTFQTNDPALLVETQLIFVSNRTALIKVVIQNKTNNRDLALAVRWSGQSFLHDVSFSQHPKGVLIDFGKNNNVGWISSHSKNGFDYEIDKSSMAFKSMIS